MHRKQGHGHDQLVFDQFKRIQVARDDQQVFFGLFVLRPSRVFVWHKAEIALYIQGQQQGFEAALADQGHAGLGGERHPTGVDRAGAWANVAVQCPAHLACARIAGVFGQALKFAQRCAAGQGLLRFGESLHIEAGGIEVVFHLRQCKRIHTMSDSTHLILGSTSRYRRELLERLRIPFDVVAPEVDETPRQDEAPLALAQRLALAKARAVAQQHPHAVVIGSDQVADLHGEPLGKPGTHERAVAQLQRMRGQTVVFQTALAVVCLARGFEAVDVAAVRVKFRDLNDADIQAYLLAEQPYDCAGSAKSEGLGIALLDAIDNDDPTALIGLPLIRTCQLLRAAGVKLL